MKFGKTLSIFLADGAPNIHQRKSIRLKGSEYSQAGLYFITICAQHRACLFGEIVATQLLATHHS
jgi:hypothetical protein